MNEHKKKIILTTLITLVPILIGLILSSKLPEAIPTHFDMNGTPDRYSSKYFTIFGLPLILAVLHLITLFGVLHDPKKTDIGDKMLSLIFYICPVISVIVNTIIYTFALGYPVNTSRVVMLLIGILFIALGNYLTKIHQNYTVGIKLPWTLNSRENWNKTHRFASKLFIIGGFIILLNTIFTSIALLIAVLVLISLIPCIYSFMLYQKGI